jgi:GrpB-like predicted nucleotidyltransferase (UPF0157 family)
LRGEVRQLFFDWLREHRPDLVERYKGLYRRGAYMHPDERRRLTELVKGPERPPDQFTRGRTRTSDTEKTADSAAEKGRGWPPDQGRLF